MKFKDLRDFVQQLEQRGELKRIHVPVSPVLEMTEICDRTLRNKGPALLFENPTGFDIPVLGNLFGTPDRVAFGMGAESVSELREIGKLLAFLKEPEPPKGLKDAWSKLPIFRKIIAMAPKVVKDAVCQEVVIEGDDVDLGMLPVQTCWPGDVGPLITWGLTVTKGPNKDRQNLGIYRQQVIGRNKVIMRWLSHRGGALDFREWCEKHPGKPFPVSVALGADPATILGAVTPVPDSLSEYAFAGLLRGNRTELVKCRGNDLQVPATAEIILEGVIHPGEMADEGPYGDHTGYYNPPEPFPVFNLSAMRVRDGAPYLTTFTGRAPDEPAVMAEALSDVFKPLLRQQLPEVLDLYLPPETCSYRVAILSIDKRYPGQARRVMMGFWSLLPQFSMTKLVIVVDGDIDIRSWSDVMWAVATRSDASRDLMTVDRTPIDHLDFAAPIEGLGGKLGIDATTKIGTETDRIWGTVMTMDKAVAARVDQRWSEFFPTIVPAPTPTRTL